MPQILVEALAKTYRVAERAPGLGGALRGLVRRRWREIHALADVTFSLEAGELLAFIGPNGAGKSTTVKILSGILRPTSGRVEVNGLVPYENRVRHVARIGVVFGQRSQLWWDLPVIDGFDLLADIYRVEPERYRRRRDELVAMLRLEPLLDQPVRQLSLGQRMRAELTAALLHDPAILYLDEPTIGLDLVSKANVREFLTEVNRERGVTILLTTHDLDDVERLCSRLVVIDHGRIVHDATLAEVKARFAPHRTVVVDLVDAAPPLEVRGASTTQVDGVRQWLRFHRDETTAAAVIAQVAAVAEIADVTVTEPDIEEVIRHVYGAA
jgi:ABC-2 type transport system ATP-binding protein